MWGPIIFPTMLPCVFFTSEDFFFSNSIAAHSIVRDADVHMLHYNANVWGFHHSVLLDLPSICLPTTFPGDGSGQRPRHSAPQPLPPRPKGETSKRSQTIQEIQTPRDAAGLRPDGHKWNTSQGRPGPQNYPKRLLSMWRLRFELLPEVWVCPIGYYTKIIIW